MIEYEKVELTEQEVQEAILEGKKKKYFHEKHKDYWESKEGKKEMVRLKKVAKQFGLI